MPADTDQNQAQQAELPEQELCPHCLTGNVEGTHFCRKCGGPLSTYAAIGPFERLFAEGHIYRKAAQRPHKLIVVLGMWVIFGPVALLAVPAALDAVRRQEVFAALIAGGLAIISVMLLWKTTVNYRMRKRPHGESASTKD